jgi:hypothetical protein
MKEPQEFTRNSSKEILTDNTNDQNHPLNRQQYDYVDICF